MTRAWFLPVVLLGCSLDKSGVGEDESRVDSAVVVADTAIEDSAIDTFEPDTSEPDTFVADTAPEEPIDTAPPDPLYIECESGTMFGGVVAVSDTIASSGKWASVPVDATPWAVGTGAPPARVELPVSLPAGTWYLWVSIYTRNGDSDAMYAGFEGSALKRFYSTDWNRFKWVGVDASGARLDFSLTGGAMKLYVGAGEPGTGCDRVALTRSATWTPP